MAFKSVISHRLVKSEDLNHHGTLFAGRCSEWFVESSFTPIAQQLPPEKLLCLKINNLDFIKPIYSGDILTFDTQNVFNGRSTLVCYTRVYRDKNPEITLCEGFATYIYLDENNRPKAHGINTEPETADEIMLFEKAKKLSGK